MFVVSLVAMAVVGVGTILLSATANTVIQLRVPDVLRGRVMSIYLAVFAGSTPIGGILMGAIGASAGVATALVLGGAISAVVAIVAWVAVLRGAVPAGVPRRPVVGVAAVQGDLAGKAAASVTTAPRIS
jgi:hypothetical protein